MNDTQMSTYGYMLADRGRESLAIGLCFGFSGFDRVCRETPNGCAVRQSMLMGFVLERYPALEVRKGKFEDGPLSAGYCANPVLPVPWVLFRIKGRINLVFLPGIGTLYCCDSMVPVSFRILIKLPPDRLGVTRY